MTTEFLHSAALTDVDRLELAALLGGLKEVVRLVRSPQAIGKVAELAQRSGLSVFYANFVLVPVASNSFGDRFFSVSALEDVGDSSPTVLYLSKPIHLHQAERLADLELKGADSVEIGARLGYPTCCSRSYRAIESGQDWLQVMLENSSVIGPQSMPCNRIARIFGPWSLLPDYFPCSFSCKESARWAAEIGMAAEQLGLTGLISANSAAMQIPIRIDRTSILRFIDPPEIVDHQLAVADPIMLHWQE